MNYDLFNQSTESREKFSGESWTRLLNLARFYGWQPMGTLPPYIHDLRGLAREAWDGTYLRNEGQMVQAEDALALAIALETALDDIPDVNIEMEREANSLVEEDDLPEWLSPAEKAMVQKGLEDHMLELGGALPFEYFAGDQKQHLAEFINFCRSGSFTIL